ncbi:taurine dioxygenase [Dactylosporangium vinaceum]
MKLEPLGPRFAAEVHDIDLDRASDETIAEVRAALVEHKVLFFRDQPLDDDGHVRLGRRLGELTASHPVVGGVRRGPPPRCTRWTASDGGFVDDVWHTDVTFVRRPPLGLDPARGHAARDRRRHELGGQPARLRVRCRRRCGGWPISSSRSTTANREFGYYLAQRRGGRGKRVGRRGGHPPRPGRAPVVRCTRETGRRGLFVNPGFTSHIVGVSEAESRGILDLLYAHLTQARTHRAAPLAGR